MNLALKYILIVVSIIFNLSISCQEKNIVKNNYFSKNTSLPIHNGLIHLNYDYTINNDNHRYFDKKELTKGSIKYNNEFYDDLMLKYDILNDKLILDPKNQISKHILIELISENINEFKLDNKTFKYYKLENSNYNGFFEVLYEKENQSLLTKHSKHSKQIYLENKVVLEYFYKCEFYIKIDNKIHKISNKKDLLNLFSNKKDFIEEYYEKNKVMLKFEYSKFLINLMIKIM